MASAFKLLLFFSHEKNMEHKPSVVCEKIAYERLGIQIKFFLKRHKKVGNEICFHGEPLEI